MKLQFRFILLLLFASITVAASLVIQHSFELQKSHRILNNALAQKKELFKYYLASEGSTFQTFSEDYSFWDDMVSFVKTDDQNWAHLNLDSGLSTFNADVDWVYRPNGTLEYSSTASPDTVVSSLILPSAFFTRLNANKFAHFYVQTSSGTLEIRAATIVPGDDPTHHDSASGYWIIGRYLGASFIKSIGDLSQSTIQFKPAATSPHDTIANDAVTFFSPLDNWRSQTVEYLSSTSNVTVISGLNTLYKQELLLLAIISAFMLIVVALAIWRFILEPVHVIETSIRKQRPELLDRIHGSKSQLGELADVVQQFFKQKLVIQEEESKKAELEHINKEKTAFLALAAHELKSPITVAKLLSDELTKAFRGTSQNSQIFSSLDIIDHQIAKLMVLISDLQLASQGKGQLAYTMSTFDYDTFLRKEITGVQYVTSQKIIIEGATGKQINADPDRLSQVVSNLIRNASKYAPGTEKIVVRSYVRSSEVITEAEDFGVGISAESQMHIFEKYYRSPDVATTFQGLGLGLSVCKDILDHMGGKIWVESSLGHGTHMYFSLPIAPNASPLANPSMAASGSRSAVPTVNVPSVAPKANV